MVSNVKPLAVIFLDMDGVMSDRLYSEETDKKVSQTYQKIEASGSIYLDHPSIIEGEAYRLLTRRAQAQCLAPEALKNLKSLIDRVSQTMQVAIVISSSWRDRCSLDELKNYLFADCFFRDLIIDKIPDDESTYNTLKYYTKSLPPDFKTPSDICNEKYHFILDDLRSRQIDFWLKENCEQKNIYSYVIIDDNDDSETWKRHPDRFVEVHRRQLFSEQDADRAYEILNTEFLRKTPDKEASVQTVFDAPLFIT